MSIKVSWKTQMKTNEELIEGCKGNKRAAQKQLYEKFSGRLMGICLRYTKNQTEAEDLLQEVFIKIFRQIKKFKGTGSFEGWLCRIAVNTSITHYHRNKNHKDTGNVEDFREQLVDHEKVTHKMASNELMEIVQSLPDIYQTVFNLYAIEGFTHKEISEQLGISEGTSKSQLSRARKLLQKKLTNLNIDKNGNEVV